MYLESGLVRGGSAIETMLVDLPMFVDPEEWGLSAIGVMTFQDEHGVTHVLDWVGADSYPEVADFVEEARRKGVSRKISHTTPVEGLTGASCLYLLHPRGRVLNADQLGAVADFRCPCGHGHQAAEGCAGLAWHLPEGNAGPRARKLADGTYSMRDAPQGGAAPEYGLAVFLKVPITCLTVIEHPDAGVQQQREARARQSGLPVFVGVE